MMTAKQWYAVRCCCKPLTIFGFIQLDATSRECQQIVTDRWGKSHAVLLKVIGTAQCSPYEAAVYDVRPVPYSERMSMTKELAVYSDDRPIEFWRNIKGFIEVKSDIRHMTES